jgi:hypothetical protein
MNRKIVESRIKNQTEPQENQSNPNMVYNFGVQPRTSTVQFEFEYLGDEKELLGAKGTCFDKDTEVLTDEGWKFWPEVRGDEKFLSVDPKTERIEWVKSIGLVRYSYNGVMHHFTGSSFDLMTTSDHNHFFIENGGKKDQFFLDNYESFKDSDISFVNRPKENRWFPANNTPTEKTIGEYTMGFSDYCQLMGWYLSEGCCFDKKERPNLSVLSIRQYEGEHLEEVRKLIEKIFGKKPHGKNRADLYIDRETGAFFQQFGHSREKYIPEDILDADIGNIEKFFYTFLKGDGSEEKIQRPNGGLRYRRRFSTSSPALRDGLSELIIKLGYRPKISVIKPKPTRHRNGVYTAKGNQYIISVNKSEFTPLSNLKVSEVEVKNEMVYDVTLEKYHTLFVRRNGYFCISCNCGCTDVWVDGNKVKGNLRLAAAVSSDVNKVQKTVQVAFGKSLAEPAWIFSDEEKKLSKLNPDAPLFVNLTIKGEIDDNPSQ